MTVFCHPEQQQRMNTNDAIVVGVPLYPDCTLLDFAGATQMFTPFTGADFKPVWIACEKEPILTTEGVSVMPNETFASAPEVDILFIPGGGGKGVSHAMLDDSFIEHLRKLADQATWVGSVCTGAFILAATGYLKNFNNLKVTTYWSQLANLDLFPEIEVEQDSYPASLIDKEAKVFSGGGVSSSIDLSLNLTELLKSKRTCESVALMNQYAPQPPVCSGNPNQAPPELTQQVRDLQQGFTETMRKATEEVIARMSS